MKRKRTGTVPLLLTAALLLLLGFWISELQHTDRKTYYRNQAAVLMYHHISPDESSSGTITPKLLREQLEYLRDKGYNFITLDEFKAYMQGSPIPDNAVLITFDDGNESFYTEGYPVFQKMQIPAVNFVITFMLDHPKASYIPPMSKEQIAELTADGSEIIEAGCHTHNLHYKLANEEAALIGRITANGIIESVEEYQDRILTDTRTCIESLQQIHGRTVDMFAYPFGLSSSEARELLREAGIQYAFTIVPRMATRDADPLLIPRINAGSNTITPEGLHESILRRVTIAR